MRRIHGIIINSFSLILMNIMFWICNYYPRHIFEIPSEFSMTTMLIKLVAMLINILYFISYNLILILIFRDNTTLFADENDSFSQRRYFKSKDFTLLFGITVLWELINRLQTELFATWSTVGAVVLTVAYWLAVYLFLTRNNKNLTVRGKKCVFLGVVITIILSAFVFLEISSISSLAETYKKYLPLSSIVTRAEMNARFLSECRLLLLDLIVSIVFVVFHWLSIRLNKSKSEKQTSKRSMIVFRIILLFFGAVFVCGIKAIIFPHFMIHSYHVGGSEGTNYQENGSVDYVIKDVSITRMDQNAKEVVCYQRIMGMIREDGVDPIKFDEISGDDCYVFIKGEQKSVYAYAIVTVEDSDIYVYRNQLICFYENGLPNAVRIDDLITLGKNETIIKLCRQLLSDGNVFVFEYAYDYLIAYDAKFIKPYIERYATGEFTTEEQAWLEVSFYQKQYIVNIAKRLLNYGS